MIAALIALSLVVLTGYSGQLSLAQFAFAGWGAWIAGEFASSFGWSFPAALAVGALLTLPLGIVIGIICLRTSGVNLAIATLALSVALYALVFNNPARTGQNGGLNVGNPTVAGLNVGAVDHPNRYGLVVIVAFVIAGIVVRNIRRGSAGRRLLAVRGNERAAASLGIGVAGARLYAFGVSSVIAAVGGILLVFRDPSATYTGFGPLGSIQVVVEAVVGGVGWILGAVAGGVLEVGGVGTQILNAIGGGSQYLPLIGGVLLLLTMLHAQDGVASKLWDQGRAVLRHIWTEKGGGNGKVPDEVAEENAWVEPVRAARLLVDDLTVRFGAVTAVSGVSLVVEPGEIVGVIGPNGAGKTTLIDAITGFVPSRCGRMELGEVALEKLSVSKRSRAGVTRSFQSLELFDEMTVLDNLRSAGEPRNRMSYLRDLVYPRTPRLPSETLAAIHVFGLEEHLNSLPSVLPQGTRRLVAIARAVSTAPSVLLLDEPAAGLDDRAAEELGSLIRQLATAWGMGILLVEHNVDMVMSVCDRIYVLDFGACIASGAPASIRQDPRVVASYLGEASADASPAESPAL
jgi:sulfate-transporting ATPase